MEREADLLSLHAPLTARRPGNEPGAGAGLEVIWHWREQSICALPAPFGTLTLQPDRRGPLDLESLAALGPTLTVRTRHGGERLRPLRGGARRQLKSLLQEARLPRDLRPRLPLVFAADRLIAVAGLWLDESVQASSASVQRARLLWSERR